MSARPTLLQALILVLWVTVCWCITDTKKNKKFSILDNRPHSRHQRQHGGSHTSGTEINLHGLEESDVNKLLPYEALENTDVRERQLVPNAIINSYFTQRNKTRRKNRFSLLDRYTTKPSRRKRHSDQDFRPINMSYNDQLVPKMILFYKEVKSNLTKDMKQLSKQFRSSVDIFPSQEKSPGDLIWDHKFSELRDNSAMVVDFSFHKAAPPSRGYPWPLPLKMSTNPGRVITINPENFKFTLNKKSHYCDIIKAAFERYGRYIARQGEVYPENINARSVGSHPAAKRRPIETLEVTIDVPCDHYPSMESDESYQLDVETSRAVLKASQVWGALRGLQTFSQMLYTCGHAKLCINKTSVEDSPRFKHRGIMLDTSRHYVSPEIIKKNMDAMEINKLNVFHWHIVDDHSFPYVSRQFPELSSKGAYSAQETYDHKVIRELIEYGRLRGIRVVPEFDTPGHVRSWGAGHPEVLTECEGGEHGPMDPSKNDTFQFLSGLFSEVMDLFPDKTIHLGGDECSFRCWQGNLHIREFMKENGLGTNFNQLEEYYVNRLLLSLNDLKKKKEYMFWQDILDNGITVPRESTIQIWKNWDALDVSTLQRATELGLRTIYSSAWYLNYVNYGKDWDKYYMVDPTEFVWTPDAKRLVIGGEACLWGEYIDDTNLLQTLWPRASAVAERLWSASHVKNATLAEPRFEEHRCRMLRADIPASPNSGPGSCHAVVNP